MTTIGTINDEGVCVDLYIPRKCHATNSLISSFDHSAVQIPIANVNAKGMIDGTTTTFCIAGYLRAQGESDHAINHLAIAKGIVRIKTGKKPRAKASKGGKGARLTVSRKGLTQRGAAPQRGAPSRKGAAGAAASRSARNPNLKQQQSKQQQGGRPARKEDGDRRQQQRGNQRGNESGKPSNSRAQQGSGNRAPRHNNRA